MATSYIKNDAVSNQLSTTNNILTDALNVPNVKFFIGSGGNYTGTLPNSNYAYGIFVVFKRQLDFHVVGINSNFGFIVNEYTNSAWTGWKTITAS